MKYLLAAASALLVASPALAHGPALGKRHHHVKPDTGTHNHYHCHKRKEICHWHHHSHWGKDAGHHGKWFMHHNYPNRYHRYYDDYYWYPAPSWEIHIH
tara:strand:- start:543 stop:839 length:297 start_codon:yes stop_codon:yes gene_type:complete